MRPMLQAWPGIPRSLAACVACAALAAAGCTMCPDPYDYSGPVPNGSAPQNDFRARSHGILPIGAAPKPFPPVVKATPQPAPAAAPPVDKPAVEQPVAEQPVMAEAESDVLRLAAEVPVVPEIDANETVAPEAGTPAETAIAAGAEPQAVQEGATQADSASSAAASVAEPQPARVAAEPALRETPGWRPRR
jgi:hypothetical protein